MILSMKIFSKILILTLMAITLWGLLPKSAVDDETIEEAIDRLILAHNEDETSHLDTGQSLQSHKASEIIDHIANSIIEDKIATGAVSSRNITTNQIVGKDFRTATDVGSGVDGVKMISTGIEMWQDGEKKVDIPTSGDPFFAGILKAKEIHFLRKFWQYFFTTKDIVGESGTGSSTLALGYMYLETGSTLNNVRSLWIPDDLALTIDTSALDCNFETVVNIANGSQETAIFGVNMKEGVPDNTNPGGIANGISFEAISGTLYAVVYDDSEVRHATALSGVTLTDWNNYRIEVIAGTSVKFYVNGVLKHTDTDNFPNITSYFPFGYYVKTLHSSFSRLLVSSLTFEGEIFQ